MDERMTRAGVALLWLACAGAACAQGLSDPMRPPGPGGAAQAVAAGAGAAPPRLQSVLLSKGRKLAVIDGRTVPLGGDFGDAKLVRIAETEVTLQRGDKLEVIKMHEGVEKRTAAERHNRGPQGMGVPAAGDRSIK